ncbi:sigma-54 interaction domain-containing protein [Fusobacterium perfoetens]|uniref:sigma-54 interaction domain-containing protein n=1 Tax=Fusobacterium perfoetens TaxID=852 RepID=UPI0009DD57F8|nr:sigma 54-interacting transcriptional regulator [Fusobacterium perfoetens]
MEDIIKEKLISNGFLAKYNFSKIIYKSDLMKECIEKAKIYSKSDNTILITGESGTGKELLAQSIHNNSSRKNFPFIAINCAAIPENLFESELFGYEKGAFTGALSSGKKGLLEKANNGTVFLDEIGDMPISFQAKLLRAIEEKQIMRIAGKENININVRFISATSKNLFKEMNEDKFRIDLFYRLNVLPLSVPPLRKRIEDITPLFKTFIGDKNIKIPENIQNALNNHYWKGNIRELRNVAEYWLLMRDTNSPLPEYLNFKKENFDDEIKLKILKYIKIIGNNIGQNKIFNFLKNDNLTIYKFKQILSELAKENYIKIEVGRKGCSLTEKGLNLINEE